LTLLSVTVAFLLFGLLEGVNIGYQGVIRASHLDRLLTDPRVPGGAPMPVSVLERIKAVPGVTRVCGRAAFFGSYRDPKNGLFALATDASDWLAVRPEFSMPAEQLAKFKATRDAIAMTPAMMKRLEVKIGDRLPLQSPLVRKDGNTVWTFELVGSFDNEEEANVAQLALIHYEYFDEARFEDPGTVDRVIVRIADPTRSVQTAAAIDKIFANSDHETRTQNEQEQVESAIRQVGDISYFTNAVTAAVLFALLFVTGNTMVQAVRERIPEFAVLKTLGFSSTAVFALVIAESVVLTLCAAAIGLSIAAIGFRYMRQAIGIASLSWGVVAIGMATAVALAIASAAVPAMKVRRMQITEALRVH
jgi:putative ABC transport system permease protein